MEFDFCQKLMFKTWSHLHSFRVIFVATSREKSIESVSFRIKPRDLLDEKTESEIRREKSI